MTTREQSNPLDDQIEQGLAGSDPSAETMQPEEQSGADAPRRLTEEQRLRREEIIAESSLGFALARRLGWTGLTMAEHRARRAMRPARNRNI